MLIPIRVLVASRDVAAADASLHRNMASGVGDAFRLTRFFYVGWGTVGHWTRFSARISSAEYCRNVSTINALFPHSYWIRMGKFIRRRRLINTSISAEAAFVPLSSLTTAITYRLFATPTAAA